MRKGRELNEVLMDIEKEMPDFNADEFLKYTEWAIQKLYNSLRDNEKSEVKCEEELISKLDEQRLKYRITKDIDHISIHYAEILDVIRKDGIMYIQVYLSVYFYDNTKNNINMDDDLDYKYWNDIWIVTLGEDIELERKKCNCVNCGAIMKYNKARSTFECEYCGNIVHNDFDSGWKIVDIELGEW